MIIIFVVVVHVGVHHLEIIQNYKMNTMFELQRLWDYWPHLRNVKVNHSLYETDCVEPLSLASTALKQALKNLFHQASETRSARRVFVVPGHVFLFAPSSDKGRRMRRRS